MGKAKRAHKKARKQARGTRQEEEFIRVDRDVARRERRRRYVVAAIPLLTLAVSAGLYWGVGDARAAGIAVLLGALLFFLYGLGTVGAAVRPRDRDRAGSIDFGRRR